MSRQNAKLQFNPIFSALFGARLRRQLSLGLGALVAPGLALAAPQGGQVVGGVAAISSPDHVTTLIQQSSQSAVIQWQDFSVGGDEYVIFQQPNASAAILNRVIGGNPSAILGQLQSNGRVFLVNPSGVMFGSEAVVDVGSLVASTLDIAVKDFQEGRYVFSGPGEGTISNAGAIRVADGGFAVLGSAGAVENSGVIAARLGDVVLASGSHMTLDVGGNGLVSFAVDQASLSEHARVANLGDISAAGGTVLMTAQTARASRHGREQQRPRVCGRH
jgi:filamentous hemagglutinin family protein